MFINQQYDFEWSESWEMAFYADPICNRLCDCCYTWDNL